ncbi:MAG: hypothetical protein GYA35_01225, partial [Thermoanaerobaculaceae bacterium]|nr:hypothetical protein [Thermoanaerobaculaceae bacterium]
MTSTLPSVPKNWSTSGRKQNPIFPLSVIVSTMFHFLLFLFLLSFGIISPQKKKIDFVNVKIIELPFGEGGALTGTPGGKTESKIEEIAPKKETPPKLTLPDKNQK